MGMVPPKIEPMPNDPQKRREWYARNMALYRHLEAHQRGMFDGSLQLLVYVVVAVAIASALAAVAMGATPIEATYRVRVPDGQGVAYGTGTAISPTHVVTNSHVVGHKLADCTVHNAAGSHSGTVIAADPKSDLAIIQIPKGGLEHVPVAQADPKPGERISIYGYGRQGILRGGQGTVLPVKFTRGGGVAMIETDLAIESGDSGSGMFSEAGELVAVQWGNGGNSAATGVSHLHSLTQVWEAQYCQNGQCLPWSRGGGVYIGGGVGIGGGYQRPARPLVPVTPPTQRPPVTPPPIQQPPTTPNPPADRLPSDLLKLAQEFDARLKAVEGRKACACDGGCQCDGKAVTGQINQQQQNITQIGVRLDALNQSLAGLKPCACDKTPAPPPPPVTKEDPCDIDKLTEEVLKRLPPQVSYFEIKRRTPKR